MTVQAISAHVDVGTHDQTRLREAAKALGSSFLQEMLKSAGVGEPPSEFGGGVGEDQFASFLRAAYADEIVEARGLGLAEQIYASLAGNTNDGRP